MKGIPKVFGTEQDVINSLAEDANATKAKLRELLNGRFAWFPVRKLDANEDGVVDDTHKVVTVDGRVDMEEPAKATERWQYELREDSNAFMFQIGLTVEKINNYLL